MLRKQIESPVEKIKNNDQRIYRFVASDERVDRMGDIIEVDGWETADWEKNPVILWGHDSRAPPIGRGVGIRKLGRPKQLLIDVLFASKEVHELAGTVEGLVDTGFIKATSVGFLPKKSEPLDDEDDSWFAPRRYKEQELLELSIVSIPANPRALIVQNAIRTIGVSGCQDVCGLVFAKELFTTEQIQLWLCEHGFTLDAKEEYKKSFFVAVRSIKNKEMLDRVPVAPGVVALIDSDTDIKHVVTGVSDYSSFTRSNEAGQMAILRLMQQQHETLVQQFIDNTKAIKDLANSTESLGTVVRELSVLAELLNQEASSPPASGKTPDEAVVDEYEKALGKLQLKIESLSV